MPSKGDPHPCLLRLSLEGTALVPYTVQNSLTFILGHPCRGQENQAAEGPRQALQGEALEREEKTTPGQERGRVTVGIYKMTHTATSALAGSVTFPSWKTK